MVASGQNCEKLGDVYHVGLGGTYSGDGSDNLGGNSRVVTSATGEVDGLGGGSKAKDGEDLNRLHYEDWTGLLMSKNDCC